MVGEQGQDTGIDMTAATLAKARAAAVELGMTNVEFVEAEAEQLPFPDESFDVVISNGVIDLILDKDAVFSELQRVLVRRSDADRRRDDPEPGQHRGSPQHRPLDRLNAEALLEAAYARLLERHWFERIETGQLVDTYARSKFEDTRRKAHKFGARGTTIKTYKPSA
jgi:SAM-dependent methyltransferase